MEMLRVSEIFVSIQGESSFAGLPCAFVRLTGCPLRCTWCDTTYAYDEGELLPVETVLERSLAEQVEIVEVTGGEPLAQPGTPALLRALCDAGRTVLLETGGSLDIGVVDSRVHVIMDVKCPGSGMAERMRLENLALLRPKDEIKFVLADRADYEYARQLIHECELHRRAGVLLSAVAGKLEPHQIVAWMLADRLPARFQLQMHKVIWPPDRRGV